MGYDLVKQDILLKFWHYGKPQHWQTSLSNKNRQKRKTKTLINRLKNRTWQTQHGQPRGLEKNNLTLNPKT